MIRGVDLEMLIEAANQSRHIETTAEHIVGMLAEARVTAVCALWPDHDGTAVWMVKGTDLLSKTIRHSRLVAFWLRDEAHADRLIDEIEHIMIESTAAAARGEFAPIGADLEFEAVPTFANPEGFYVVKDGTRIARRGRSGTSERGRWMPLIPTYAVRDITPDEVEVKEGKAMLVFGKPH
jgi:hypothetical protein